MFGGVKLVLTSGMSLSHLGSNFKIVVALDASESCIGTLILQENGNGSLNVFRYALRSLLSNKKIKLQLNSEVDASH